MTSEPPRTLDLLLAQSDWVTALARALVRDDAAADDAVQATWLDVLRHPPRVLQNPRAFLATLLRRQVQRGQRSARRRQRHEAAVAVAPDASVPSAAELTGRLQTHRELVDAVLALDEPYRSTVVLRWFEHLDVEAIAQCTGTPANTVRSRLQRALQQLRARLDSQPGGRQRWLGALVVLAQRPLPGDAATVGSAGVAAGAVSGGVALALTMKPWLTAVAAALVLGVLSWFALAPSDAPLAPPAGTGGALAATAAASPSTAPPSAAAAPARQVVPGVTPKPERQLVDRDGRALVGVAMRVVSDDFVRWQGGDRGWISGPEGTRRIPAEEEERLRRDAAYAATWFAQFATPAAWRAEILGTPWPEREVTTGADGGFTFPVGTTVRDAAVEVGDARYVLTARGERGAAPWCAGPASRVDVIVRDEAGAPVDDAFAVAMTPADGGRELPGAIEVRSDDAGRLLVRRALGGGLLRVRAEGFATAWVPVPEATEQRLEVVLRRRADGERREVAGLVVDGGGRPIEAARVWFGRQRTTTGVDGRFRFAADDVVPEHALTVVAAGRAALQRERFGAAVVADPVAARDLLLVLDGAPATATGTVIGSDGLPLAGALVHLLDGTVLDVSFTPVEGLVGGFEQTVTTARDGGFVLPGLGARSYRIAATDPATGARAVAVHRAADGPLVLRLPQALRRAVAGRVVRDGAAVPEARVAIGFVVHVTKGGGTMIESTPEVATDAEGRFVLPVLPRRYAFVGVRSGARVVAAVPVETVGDGELVIDVDGSRWLQLLTTSAHAGASLHFVVGAEPLVAARTAAGPAHVGADGEAPVVRIPPDATAVVLAAGTPGERRLPLTDDLAVHLRVP